MDAYTNSSEGQRDDYYSEQEDPYTVTPVKQTIIVAYLALLPASVLGNVLVIFVIVRNKKLRTVTNFFLCNLAVADLMVAIFCIVPKMLSFVMSDWPFGATACSLHNYVVSVTTKASIFTLTLIAFERYFAILHPFRVRHLLTTTKLAIATGLLWAISLWLSVPIYYMYGTVSFYGVEFCGVAHAISRGGKIVHDIAMMTICFLLPLLFMVIFYSKIIGKLWCGLSVMNMHSGFYPSQSASHVRFRQRFSFQTEITCNETNTNVPANAGTYETNVIPLGDRSHSNGVCDVNRSPRPGSRASEDIPMSEIKRNLDPAVDSRSSVSGSPVVNSEIHTRKNMYERNQTRRKVVRMLIAVVVSFIICMFPMQLFFVWEAVGSFPVDTAAGMLFLPFAYAMYFLNSCINPAIYAILSSNFRSKMKETLLCNMTHAQTSIYTPDQTRKRSISESPTSV